MYWWINQCSFDLCKIRSDTWIENHRLLRNQKSSGTEETHSAHWFWQRRRQQPTPRPELERIVRSPSSTRILNLPHHPPTTRSHSPSSTSNNLVVDTWLQDKTPGKEATGQEPASNWFAGWCWRPVSPPPIVHRFGLSSSYSYSSCNYYQLMYTGKALHCLLEWTITTLLNLLVTVYDTVSDVVESKVHQCQQNSDA